MTNATMARRAQGRPTYRRVIRELGRFDGRLLLRSPLLWIGVAGSLALLWYWLGAVAPILQRDSIYLAGGMLPLAAATLLATADATRRRHQLSEILDSLPHCGPDTIRGGQVGLIAPVGLALILQLVAIGYLAAGGPVGYIDWPEFVMGPVVVAGFGLGGVLLGARFRNPIVTPVALVGIAFLMLMSSPDTQIFSPEPGPTAAVEWLSPWIVPSSFEPTEALIARPSALHLAYLLVLCVLLALWAVPIGGTRRLGLWATSAAFIIAVSAVSVATAEDLPHRFDWLAAAQSQICETHDGIEYCAFDLYQPWIDDWAETISAVDHMLPVSIERVVQRPDNIAFDPPGTLEQPGLIVVGTEWDRAGALPSQRFNLALLAAHSAVGLPLTKQTRQWTEAEIDQAVADNPDYPDDLRSQLEDDPGFPHFCSAFGQARAVVAVWLAAASLDRGEEALAAEVTKEPIRRIFWIPIEAINGRAPTYIEGVDAELAYQLLALPTDEVRATLEARWPEIINPDTSSTQLAGWFGLTRPPAPDVADSTAKCE